MSNLKLASAVVILIIAIGAFMYSNTYGQVVPVSSNTCPVCSGRFGGDMNCVDVNIGGAHSCTEWANGDCDMGAPCDSQGPQPPQQN
jgi:hypothetical protein